MIRIIDPHSMKTEHAGISDQGEASPQQWGRIKASAGWEKNGKETDCKARGNHCSRDL
jgi:hypothetical protein